ncbi:hypothetical protein HYFRA_00009454 [Hymenoscyphus fraxineus]|uniref:DUF7514 domain-containing protein n=1 Tax=Hymenoscyphus fraxineus TaxID=746836 RepID=A0A9N9L591_9HELO|nr:hypothetical protein HYFRA_00009454 [Hymenoscyphus fraxineus]
MEEEEPKNQLYCCNTCTDMIPNTRARVLCHHCLNYHLCANCYVAKNYARPHVDNHPTMVFKQSGYFVPGAPGFAVKVEKPPPLPPRQPAQTSIQDIEIPMADWSVLWSLIKSPSKKNSKTAAKADILDEPLVQLKDVTGAGLAVMTNGINELHNPNFPPSPPKSVDVDGSAPSYPIPETWEPLFAADSTPAPIFIALMGTIFSCLDPRHTGFLTPEVYSDFLDVQGYQWTANVWKNSLDAEGGENHKEIADLEFGIYLADLSISHKLMVRAKSATQEEIEGTELVEPKSPASLRVKEHMNFGANMPILSRQGFIDLSAIEYLVSPTKGHEYLQKAIDEYGIWKQLGKLPRSMLPDNSLPKASQIRSKATDAEVKEADKNVGNPIASMAPALPSRQSTGLSENFATPVSEGEKEQFDEVDLKVGPKSVSEGPRLEEDQVKNGKRAASIADSDDGNSSRKTSSESGKSFMELYKES